jgi:hypothetical protein
MGINNANISSVCPKKYNLIVRNGMKMRTKFMKNLNKFPRVSIKDLYGK